MFCEYKYIFGKPKEGIHKYRLFDLAIVDVAGTIICSYIISELFKWNFLIVLFVIFVIGILMHMLFCVNTTIGVAIFGRIKSE